MSLSNILKLLLVIASLGLAVLLSGCDEEYYYDNHPRYQSGVTGPAPPSSTARGHHNGGRASSAPPSSTAQPYRIYEQRGNTYQPRRSAGSSAAPPSSTAAPSYQHRSSSAVAPARTNAAAPPSSTVAAPRVTHRSANSSASATTSVAPPSSSAPPSSFGQ